jgi:hypothetical protein
MNIILLTAAGVALSFVVQARADETISAKCGVAIARTIDQQEHAIPSGVATPLWERLDRISCVPSADGGFLVTLRAKGTTRGGAVEYHIGPDMTVIGKPLYDL